MKYFIRSVKYFLYLCVLCMAIILLNRHFSQTQPTLEETFRIMFHSTRGALLPLVMVIAAALYPRFGFARRRIEGDVTEHRTQIINALSASGFELTHEEDEVMHFRAKSIVRRIFMLWDDHVEVSQYGQWIVIEGIRRGVATSAYRLQGFINALERHE